MMESLRKGIETMVFNFEFEKVEEEFIDKNSD